MRRALFALRYVFLLGCSSVATEEVPEEVPAAPFGGSSTATTPAESSKPAPAPKPVPVPDADLLEVVLVMIDGDRGWCTGTLVSKDVVVTAAHCLDKKLFKSWEVVAPRAPGAPKRAAAEVRMFEDDFEDVANPDIGAIVLAAPIELPAYGVLTDVTARVKADGIVTGATMVRQYVGNDAPLTLIDDLEISSGAPFGYEHGLVSKFFSKGGDSGAGLFLIENGRRTHKLIGAARQPEPDKDRDHFTHVNPAFMTWVKSLGSGND